jgi:P-type E1-E2 ATPase
MIVSFLAVVASSYLTAAWSKRKKRKEKCLHFRLLPQPQPSLTDDYHTAIEQKIDSLLGVGREQHLQSLDGLASAQISEAAKQDNRYLVIAALNAAAAITLAIVAPLWLILTVPLSLYLVRRPFQDAWQGLVQERRMTVSLVDAIAVSAAILAGFWQMTAISLLLYAVALKLLNTTRQKSRQQLSGLFMQSPAGVWVQRDGVETEISIEYLQEDDIVVVRSGEVIPVDGIILEGTALVDQRILTGESQPAEKQLGDEVFAFTLLLSGRLELKVHNAGQHTVASRIGDILQKTADYKNQHEYRAEQLADRAVAPTLLLSVLALPISGVSGAIGVLWSCFGYTMRISSPMSVMNFLRHASEQHILIKDGMALDVLPSIDTVVFDKTGTLTEEQPELHLIHSFGHYADKDILTFAAAAEYRQAHPIARAIINAAQQQNLSLPDAEDGHCQLGYGIETHIAGKITHIGSTRFIESVGIAIPEMACQIQAHAESQGHSVVMLAIGGLLAGAIELRPKLRPSAYTTIQALKARGIHTCIISGDRENPTRNLGCRN